MFHLSSEYVASVASGCFESRSGVASPSSLSVASPWCLLLSFCCLAPSFSDRGGATRASEGGALGAGGRDASGDSGVDASARCPLPLAGDWEMRPDVLRAPDVWTLVPPLDSRLVWHNSSRFSITLNANNVAQTIA